MAAESGKDFYAELPFTIDTRSPFIRNVVVPLLGKRENIF
jgi:hypothetical protein